MSSTDDRIFIIARAMARHDGHDPDQLVMDAAPYRVRQRDVAVLVGAGGVFPLWQLYTGLAATAVETIKKLPE